MAQLVSFHVMESPGFQSTSADMTESVITTPAVTENNGSGCRGSVTRTVWSTATSAIPSQLNHGINGNNRDAIVDISLQESAPALVPREPVTISWTDITLSMNKGKVILKDLNGKFKPGELSAIMGPSGAGKTTFLNVLAGCTRRKYSGKVMINGRDREMNSFRNISCYVTQDNNLFDYLTVKESMNMAADLKIKTSVTKTEKKFLVQKLLDSLGMNEVKETKGGKLSGGERKRLCIAQEIVSNPNLILLDEPTSGLDSSSCMQCVKLLKSLANDGRTIVCTIHQPSARILELFDKVYLMAEGKCMYRGPVNKLVKYLDDQGLHCPQYHNPADFAMEVVSGELGQWNQKLKEAAEMLNDDENEVAVDKTTTIPARKIEATFEASTLNLLPPDKKNRRRSMLLRSLDENVRDYPTSSWNQFKVLLYRNFICSLRNPIITHMQLVVYVLSSLFIGALFNGIGNDAAKVYDNAGIIFFCTGFNFFLVQTSTILTFPFERVVIAREHLNNWYSIKNYFLARTVTDLPYQIIFPIIFTSIVYWITYQPPQLFRFGLVTLSIILLYIVAQSFGVIMGALFDAQTATFVASGITVIVAVFCGFIVTFDTMPSYLRWMTYLSYGRYIFLGIAFAIYGMDRTGMDCSSEICPTPKQFMKYLGVKESDAYIYYGAPVIFAVVFKIAGYYIIRYKINRTTLR